MINGPFCIRIKNKKEPIVLLFVCIIWLIGAIWASAFALLDDNVREGILGIAFLVPFGIIGCLVFTREIRK